MEQLTQFVLNSSFPFSFLDNMTFDIPTWDSTHLLDSLSNALSIWKGGEPAVQKRGKQILSKLCDEGLSDSLEMMILLRSEWISNGQISHTYTQSARKGVWIVRQFGGIRPFWNDFPIPALAGRDDSICAVVSSTREERTQIVEEGQIIDSDATTTDSGPTERGRAG
ncbi:hypothetical protein BLNAU_17278 [Blattamonas nauphoetae]|uniref:Uncharacterized protein n=1 Tax=Blattamonas nauphoetae TaxID=2049346 RepID=A0ABQ9X8Q1_9EUKA|nr:hypothetical protein BLNAU_17278 [Blattamonas nauphoetae]